MTRSSPMLSWLQPWSQKSHFVWVVAPHTDAMQKHCQMHNMPRTMVLGQYILAGQGKVFSTHSFFHCRRGPSHRDCSRNHVQPRRLNTGHLCGG